MKSSEWNFRTSDDLQLFAREWVPERKPKAIVCLVHGLGEHCGRYTHVGEALCKGGYVMLGFDLRGHGRSEGPRGHTPSFEQIMKDMDGYLEEAEKRFPGHSRFLYGHSLGGILVLNYALRRKPTLAGVIATGSGLRTALEKQKMKVTFAKVMGRLLPKMTLPSGLDPNTISQNPDIVQAYINDPLVHDQISLGMARNLMEAIQWAFAHAPEFPVPLLIMHGVEDRLGFKEGSQEFADLVKKDCTLKLWDGLYHELHNEPERADVFKYIIDWMDLQVKK